MEDGGESRVIKNMKMNKFWDAVLGSSQQLQSFSLAPYLNFAQLKESIKEKKRRKNNFCYCFPTSFFSWLILHEKQVSHSIYPVRFAKVKYVLYTHRQNKTDFQDLFWEAILKKKLVK